jgi:hypothetical protein
MSNKFKFVDAHGLCIRDSPSLRSVPKWLSRTRLREIKNLLLDTRSSGQLFSMVFLIKQVQRRHGPAPGQPIIKMLLLLIFHCIYRRLFPGDLLGSYHAPASGEWLRVRKMGVRPVPHRFIIGDRVCGFGSPTGLLADFLRRWLPRNKGQDQRANGAVSGFGKWMVAGDAKAAS